MSVSQCYPCSDVDIQNKVSWPLTGNWHPVGAKLNPTTWHAFTKKVFTFQAYAMNIYYQWTDRHTMVKQYTPQSVWAVYI